MNKTKKLCDQRESRRGASAIEFSFVAPVLFLFVFGLIEVGRAMSVQQAVTNAAREGCRKAVIATTRNKDDVEFVVRRYLRSVLPSALDSVSVVVTPQSFTAMPSGTEITVNVRVNYSDVSWLPAGYLGDPVLGAEASQRRE